ncbi:hypothetical protein KUTeg_003449 [Tegillarca granosa]|uniref:Receptor ligand binding region domain-containing protein n=1 Tax=Tegillarca granosa TaxID=220873 RepID=A0ABQ9FRQ1_TEGGR|nr:hypothetical protein KUTeg_003449 [Tegillarca granosa]
MIVYLQGEWLIVGVIKKCADYDVSDKIGFPTFARTYPPATRVVKPVISLLLHYNWRRFTLIHGSSHKHKEIAAKLLERAEQENITLNGDEEYKEPHLPLTTGNPFPGIVERTFVDTRGNDAMLIILRDERQIYVFLGGINGIVDIMTNLHDRGLLDTGEYIVIYVDNTIFDPSEPLRYFKHSLGVNLNSLEYPMV